MTKKQRKRLTKIFAIVAIGSMVFGSLVQIILLLKS